MTTSNAWRKFSTYVALASGVVCLNAQPTPPFQGNWTLTFQDEFNGQSLDGDKWKVGQHWPGIAGSGSNDPDQIEVADGVLKITAAEKSSSFSGKDYSYAAGEVSTFKKFNQKYGYYECRMRYHAVQGMWAAFWLMPDHEEYGWDGKYRHSFIQFDLSGVSGGSVSSAVLKLTPTSVQSGNASPNVLVMKCLDDSWTETGINWNNQPTPDPLFIKQLYGTSVLSAGTTVSIDVTDYINDELSGDETASFAMMDSFMRNLLVSFASREYGTAAYRPQLLIDGQTVYASADSYVRLSEPTTNFGTATTLQVADAYGNSDTASTYGTGNEVDIMESLGRWGPDRTQHAVHWDGYSSNHKSVESGHIAYPSDGDDYHTYGLYWESGRYEFYVDGIKTYEWINAEVMESKAHIILSLQLGGWDGGVIPDLDGRSIEVDYVRVWSGTKTGSAVPGGGEGPAPAYHTVSVSEDTYVRSGSYANDNFGSEAQMYVKATSQADYSREVYLKFDVSGLDPNAERIELVLDPPVGPSPRDTLIYVKPVSDDTWSEDTMTWNTKPDFGTTANARRFETTDLDFVIDITHAVKEEINGDGIVSFRLAAANDAAYTLFMTKESTGTAPYLRATPAPASGSYVSFDVGDMSSYDIQDYGSGSVGNGGSSVSLSGNSWKKFPLSYTVTADTILRFTVDSSDTGEIIGVGLDENGDFDDAVRVIQVGGSQTWAGAHAVDPSLRYIGGSGPIEYEVTLGGFYTGSMNYIGFVGDDDANASTSVTYSNIELFENPGP